MDERRGPLFLFKHILIPALGDSYEDLYAATEGADLLVSHVITFAAPLVAEKRDLRWISIVLQPMMYFSVYDPPVLPGIPGAEKIRRLSPGAVRLVILLPKMIQAGLAKP